jgi:hypothetical protein
VIEPTDLENGQFFAARCHERESAAAAGMLPLQRIIAQFSVDVNRYILMYLASPRGSHHFAARCHERESAADAGMLPLQRIIAQFSVEPLPALCLLPPQSSLRRQERRLHR